MNIQAFGKRFQYDNSFNAQPIRLEHFELVQIGELCTEPDFEVGGHQQFCCELSCIISGKGTSVWNDQALPVSPGDLVVTPPNGWHTIRSAADDTLFFAYLGFRFVQPCSLPAPLVQLFTQPCQQVVHDTYGLYEHFRRCIDEFYARESAELLLIDAYLTQILILCGRCFSHPLSSPGRGQKPVSQSSQPVYRALKYADHHIFEPLTVSGLAAALGYDACYLSHVFKSKMGCTLQQYLARRKAEQACRLLEMGRFTVTAVAEKLGYTNVQSFSRAFKKATGFYPSAYGKTDAALSTGFAAEPLSKPTLSEAQEEDLSYQNLL